MEDLDYHQVERLVHYGDHCDTAIITHVFHNQHVNLSVFSHDGKSHVPKTSVIRSLKPEAHKWHFMDKNIHHNTEDTQD